MKSNKSVILSVLAVSNVMLGSLFMQEMTNSVIASSMSEVIVTDKKNSDDDFRYIKITFKLGEAEIGRTTIGVPTLTPYISSFDLESLFDFKKYTFADESIKDTGYVLKNDDDVVIQLKEVPPVDTTRKSLKILNFRIVNAQPNESVSPLLFDFYDFGHEFELPTELIPNGFGLTSTLIYPTDIGYSVDITSEKDSIVEPDYIKNNFKSINVIFKNENGDILASSELYTIKDSISVSNDTVSSLLKYNNQLSEYEMIKSGGNVNINGNSITVPIRKLSPKNIRVDFLYADTGEVIDSISTKVKRSSRYISKEQILGIMNEYPSKFINYNLDQDNNFFINNKSVSVLLTKDSIIKPNPSPSPKPESKPDSEKKYHTTVNFLDQATQEKITTLQLFGKHGQKYSLILPEGYDLAENESNDVVIDKAKNEINIKIVKRSGNVSSFSGNVTTHKLSKLYTKDGEVINNRGLAENSDWHVDKKIVIKGKTYYGVSTYEYVKASDIFEYISINASVTTTNGKVKYLYDSKGRKFSNRALAPNTSWRTDKSATINGKHAYRVSTSEWLLSDDKV